MEVLKIIFGSILAAIIFGVIHDQVTARICVEYFTIGHVRLIDSDSPTILGLFWGVAATWWVGLVLGVGLAFVARFGKKVKLGWRELCRPIFFLMLGMYSVALIAGGIGYLTSQTGVFLLVESLASRIPAEKHVAFLTVGWAHAGSYLAGAIGGMILWRMTWKRRGGPSPAPRQSANLHGG